ncbi:hypothetical protein B0J17DRAFT_702999 [Rhizoctonia solani]|nr:hypothetical protein B0J17DRAFT_702999 [Rhizoctonia solani]
MLRITSVTLASLALAAIVPMGKPSAGGSSHAGSINLPRSGSVPGPLLWQNDPCQPGQYPVGEDCVACGQGHYCSGNGDRNACPIRTYSDKWTSNRDSDCKPISCGYQPTGGNADGTAATGQTPCGIGYYSDGKSITCTICPKGKYCDTKTTCIPKRYDPGTFADTTGSGEGCKKCPAGTFNNSYGNTSCCNCCAGWYSQGNNTHTSCEQCSSSVGIQFNLVTGPAGSNSKDKCVSYGARSLKRSTMTTCLYGTTRCEVKSGRGGFDTCGGCDNDCSLLEGTDEVQCLKGHCVIKSCAPAYSLVPRGDGISRGGLDVGVQCIAKKRSHIRRAFTL